MGYLLLKQYGFDVDSSVFDSYEREAYFECYPYEMDSSVGVNAHVLEALTAFPHRRQEEVKAKLLAYLRSQRINGAYWFDKWHISPYYATTQVIFAVAPIEHRWVEASIRWIEETLKPSALWDGS